MVVLLFEANGNTEISFSSTKFERVGTFDSLAPHGSLIPAGHVTRCAGSCPNGLQAFGRFHCGCPMKSDMQMKELKIRVPRLQGIRPVG
jgi:hypothetical protein